MIFSAFRKKKWENKNPHVRINAIQELLATDDASHKNILLSLAEHDDNELVRRAAITQLSDFFVFVSQSLNNTNEQVKAFCAKQVDEILANNHTITLSESDKVSYLSDSDNKHRLEAWLHGETHANIVIALYKKLAKPQLLFSLFTQNTDPLVQAFLIEEVDTVAQLEKMLKKSPNQESTTLIEQKLAQLNEAIEKPIKLRKNTQLVLAKLLSLKDTPEYADVVNKQAALSEEWEACVLEFSLLPGSESDAFIEKYQHITHQLKQLFQEKSEQYQQALVTKKLDEDRKDAQVSFKKALTDLNHHITRCIFETELIDEAVYQEKLSLLSNDIAESVLIHEDKSELQLQVEKQSHILESLPVIAQSITEATHLISRISQLVLPTTLLELNERFATYQEWEREWENVFKKSNGILPVSILDAHAQIAQSWQQGLKDLLAEQKSAFFQAQKKIKEFNRLIEQGKFKPSFYVYSKLTSLYEVLSVKQKDRLSRDYEAVVKKHNELADWEHYISTPRKQALLEEVQKLVETPKDNPNEQAKEVKAFRQKWNALGHAEDTVENELNEAFNVACEEAFAPCRLFYKEQDKLRANNLEQREKLISEAEQFCTNLLKQKDEGSLEYKSLESQLQVLQKTWKNAGEVEKDRYRTLNADFQKSIKPVVDLIHEYHAENKSLKLALIKSAEQALISEDIFKAVNEVKALQKTWKDTGFSGPGQDNKLWQQFRKINDEIFAKRDKKQGEDKARQASVISAFEAQLTTFKTTLDQAKSLDEIKATKLEIESVLSEVYEHKPPLKPTLKRFHDLVNDSEKRAKNHQNKAAENNIKNVFSVVEAFASEDLSHEQILAQDLFLALPNEWKKTFNKLASLNNHVCRQDKTLALEILANVESPEAYKAQRLAMQVNLLQESLVNGEAVNTKKLLKEWILLGNLSPDDLPLLQRIAPIYR